MFLTKINDLCIVLRWRISSLWKKYHI